MDEWSDRWVALLLRLGPTCGSQAAFFFGWPYGGGLSGACLTRATRMGQVTAVGTQSQPCHLLSGYGGPSSEGGLRPR